MTHNPALLTATQDSATLQGMEGLTGTKGGSGVWQRIISEIPPHDVFIEPFWGRGTISKRKKAAAITIGIDPDPDAISSAKPVGALMFRGCGLQWLKDYFRIQAGHDAESDVTPNHATFGGFPWDRHFVYLDPPYLGCSGYYKQELTEEQHIDLCRVFLALPCPAALSGYRTDVSDAELSDCRSISYWTNKRSGQQVREYLWCNYPQPSKLHDARFVGVGRRQRQRIARRRRNWQAGFEKMGALEQQTVFEAIQAAYQAVTPDPASVD